MDGFSGYNQIKIAPEDQHKTAFTCPWGTFCWNVMPFGLKNAGATYQRAMTTIFHDLMHVTMEDYVDDLLVKSIDRNTHLDILSVAFDRLEKYKAFQTLKDYLLNLPVLIPPVPDQPLLLYISTTPTALGALLTQQITEGKEKSVYYISRTLVGYELNYTAIERACLVVVFASQKLRHYMLTHKTKLVARIDPLKYLLNKATLTGRLAKWVMILSEFDIEYVDRKAIKGQAIADQLVDAPMIDDVPLSSKFPNESILTMSHAKPWQLYFDGSYTQHGAGAGILFITPQGDSIPKSYRLSFPCTNNIAEYEALTIGL
ncbi:hypothetical protein SUGI_0276010 [Cryptomeria japonica]|nr:hypothetical protein SUGI_0276010 [Cryptomeria japonica]